MDDLVVNTDIGSPALRAAFCLDRAIRQRFGSRE